MRKLLFLLNAWVLIAVLTVTPIHSFANQPLSCSLSGMAKLLLDYGELKKGAKLDVKMEFEFNGRIGLQEGAIGSMVVTHESGSKFESEIYYVQSWDRKPPGTGSTSFVIHIHGSYLRGDVGGIGGVPKTSASPGTRPGVELVGKTAGLDLHGNFPVTEADWNLLSSRRTLTLADPNRLEVVTYTGRFETLSVVCESV